MYLIYPLETRTMRQNHITKIYISFELLGMIVTFCNYFKFVVKYIDIFLIHLVLEAIILKKV